MSSEIGLYFRNNPASPDVSQDQRGSLREKIDLFHNMINQEAVSAYLQVTFPAYNRRSECFEEEREPESDEERIIIDREALAIGIMAKNPGWSVQQIADHVGVNRGTLYRAKHFKACLEVIRESDKKALKASLPRGVKEVDRGDKTARAQLDAWYEDDEERDE